MYKIMQLYYLLEWLTGTGYFAQKAQLTAWGGRQPRELTGGPGGPGGPFGPSSPRGPCWGKEMGLAFPVTPPCCHEHGSGWACARLSIALPREASGLARQWSCWFCSNSGFLGLQTAKRNPVCTYPWIIKINNIGTDIYSSDWKKAHLNQLF